MKWMYSPCLLSMITTLAGALALAADEQPPEDAFERSGFALTFAIPDSFGKPVGGNRGYLQTDGGRAPIEDMKWEHDGDTILIRWMVVPDRVWQFKTTDQMFADAKNNMLIDKALKLVSERDYKINNSPAHSFVFVHEGGKPQYQRMDYIFTKPDLNVVMYTSSSKTALDDPVCQELFESLSIKPKAPKK